MKHILLSFIIIVISATAVHAQVAEIFGYFEPQYNGIYFDDTYYQFHSNKLRVDLKSTSIANTELGADVIFLLYHGKTDWNIIDFLPEAISSTILPELYPLFEFTYRDTLYLDNVYARLAINRFALTAGKQQISLGTGYFANPTDIFNTKDALDPTYEQPGHNGIPLEPYGSLRANRVRSRELGKVAAHETWTGALRPFLARQRNTIHDH